MKKPLFVLLLFSFTFGQDPSRIPLTVNLIRFPESLTISNLTSTGVSFLANRQVADIASGNPAALCLFSNISAGVSWQFESDLDGPDIIDIALIRGRTWLPQSAGIIYPFTDSFRLASGMHRRYSSRLDFKPVIITTPEMPAGTGEFFEPVMESSVTTYSVSAGYTFNGLLSAQYMTFAVRYNLDYMSTHEEIGRSTAEASGFNYSWAAGIIAQFDLQEVTVHFGASFEGRVNIEENMVFDSDFSFDLPDTNLIPGDILQQEATPIVAKIPARLNFGASLSFGDELNFGISLSQVLWSDFSDGLDDVIEIAANFSKPVLPCLTASIGFYSTGINYTENALAEEPDAFYVTTGIRLFLGRVVADVVLADSHLSSADRREQTIFKLATAISL